MNRKQWWSSGIILLISAYSSFTLPKELIAVEGMVIVAGMFFALAWLLGTLGIICLVCGYIEKEDNKK